MRDEEGVYRMYNYQSNGEGWGVSIGSQEEERQKHACLQPKPVERSFRRTTHTEGGNSKKGKTDISLSGLSST